MPKFSAEIRKIGINPFVAPTEEVLSAIFAQSGRDKGPMPVHGSINGAPFIQTLVRYAGTWRLYINGPMLKSSGSKLGDIVTIEVEYDPRPRGVEMPPKLKAAFRIHANAKMAFDLLPPSRQKEILRYINSLKYDESVERNVARVISQLSGSDAEPPVFMRRKRDSK